MSMNDLGLALAYCAVLMVISLAWMACTQAQAQGLNDDDMITGQIVEILDNSTVAVDLENGGLFVGDDEPATISSRDARAGRPEPDQS